MGAAGTVKFLIFQAGESAYALPAAQVREIAADLPRYPVPFTPDWVRGVLNRHGEPYTVLDIQALLGGELLEDRSYLVLNLPDDQVAILISTVREISALPAGSLHAISSADSNNGFFQGVLSTGNTELPVLDLASILKRLADDVRLA